MNQLNAYLARHEIDRRLRAVEHHRRVRRSLTDARADRSTVAVRDER
jgi:hypothetical protein